MLTSGKGDTGRPLTPVDRYLVGLGQEQGGYRAIRKVGPQLCPTEQGASKVEVTVPGSGSFGDPTTSVGLDQPFPAASSGLAGPTYWSLSPHIYYDYPQVTVAL